MYIYLNGGSCMSESLKTLAEIRAAANAASEARNRLTYLFDDGKFTELDPYAMTGSELSGVVTAFGYVGNNPVYAFSQDINVRKGAMTEAHAKKISKVFSLAAKTGVPVVGIYDSYGADVSDPSAALSAYGYLLSKVSNLSGVSLPTIQKMESGSAGNINLSNLLKIMRFLGILENVNQLVPEQPQSPYASRQRNRIRHGNETNEY